MGSKDGLAGQTFSSKNESFICIWARSPLKLEPDGCVLVLPVSRQRIQ